MKIRKLLIALVVLLCLCIVALFGVRWWVICHLKTTKIAFLDGRSHNLQQEIDSTATGITNGNIPTRGLDLRSIGRAKQEADLLEYRHWVQMYDGLYGEAPPRSEDLDRLLEGKAIDWHQRESIKKSAHDCRITVFGSDSYLLSCDEWQLPDKNSLLQIVSRFKGSTERFYVVQGHVILYAPPFAVIRGS